jgi:hypothetical protein
LALLRKAAEIRAQAEAISDPFLRAELAQIAQRYERMAAHIERTDDAAILPEQPSGEPPPTRQ